MGFLDVAPLENSQKPFPVSKVGLKQEYGIGYGFKTKALALKVISQTVNLYNTRRLHTALNYQVPEAVHIRGTVEYN